MGLTSLILGDLLAIQEAVLQQMIIIYIYN